MTTLPKKDERIVEEFNSPNHNDSMLGRYLQSYEDAKTPYGISEGENKKADKKINNWFRKILTTKNLEMKQAVEEERNKVFKIEILDNGATMTVNDTQRFYGFKRMTKPLMYEYEFSLTEPLTDNKIR